MYGAAVQRSALTPCRHCSGRARLLLALVVGSNHDYSRVMTLVWSTVLCLLTKQTNSANNDIISFTSHTVRVMEARHIAATASCHSISMTFR